MSGVRSVTGFGPQRGHRWKPGVEPRDGVSGWGVGMGCRDGVSGWGVGMGTRPEGAHGSGVGTVAWGWSPSAPLGRVAWCGVGPRVPLRSTLGYRRSPRCGVGAIRRYNGEFRVPRSQ
jgi:hypothetical protein